MSNKLSKETNDLMSKDPDNWKGIFYINKEDPRILVPKINPSLGWTLNFGNIYAYAGLLAIILIIIASQYYF